MAIPLQTRQLKSAEDYFQHVIVPNKREFFGHASAFASALNLATCLFHFHEWLYAEYRPQLEKHFGQMFKSKGRLWGAVQNSDGRFAYIRDLTNASKHVQIGGQRNAPPSTGMSHIANTHIVAGLGHGGGGLGRGRFGDSSQVMFADGSKLISYDECANALFDYWKLLLEQLTGRLQPA